MDRVVPEIDVLIGVVRWLWAQRTLPVQFSIATGQGINAQQNRQELERALEALDIPDNLRKYKYFSGTGPDVEAFSATVYWRIECKGAGAGKSSTQRNNFDRALASVVSYYEDTLPDWPDHELRLGLALPNTSIFLGLLKSRVRQPLRKQLNLSVLLYQIDDEGVISIRPDEDY